MLLCCGVTNVAETLVIAQSFWLVLVEKKIVGILEKLVRYNKPSWLVLYNLKHRLNHPKYAWKVQGNV